NVYPSFKNKNSELFISFNPKTMTLTYENLTTKYMQVNSIDLYYNNKVYTIANNKTQNFSTELSPESRETLLVTELIEESFHKNITKKKALGTQIAFGFSVKYTVGDSTQNKTLYKRDKMSLYSLIKEK
ncbi:MAG: hypothetical protein U9N39_02940, partial [Campylobacterota bacterium]|nr:hypothetical protein [Campylobacterota bacterium]